MRREEEEGGEDEIGVERRCNKRWEFGYNAVRRSNPVLILCSYITCGNNYSFVHRSIPVNHSRYESLGTHSNDPVNTVYLPSHTQLLLFAEMTLAAIDCNHIASCGLNVFKPINESDIPSLRMISQGVVFTVEWN